MSSESPQKADAKKQGRTLQEKRAAKKDEAGQVGRHCFEGSPHRALTTVRRTDTSHGPGQGHLSDGYSVPAVVTSTATPSAPA